jgi:hypothetical protein
MEEATMTTETSQTRMTMAQRKAWVLSKLDASDRNVELAVLAIFARQTASEQASSATLHNNDIGFTGTDARRGTRYARILTQHGSFAAFNASRVYSIYRIGIDSVRSMMRKYWRQLVEVAEAKGTLPARTRRAPRAAVAAPVAEVVVTPVAPVVVDAPVAAPVVEVVAVAAPVVPASFSASEDLVKAILTGRLTGATLVSTTKQ